MDSRDSGPVIFLIIFEKILKKIFWEIFSQDLRLLVISGSGKPVPIPAQDRNPQVLSWEKAHVGE
jgi:hypothetical protein